MRRRTEVAVPTGMPGQGEGVPRRNTIAEGGYDYPPAPPSQEQWQGGEYTLGPGGPGQAYVPPPPPQQQPHPGPPAGYHPQVAGAGWGGDYAVRR